MFTQDHESHSKKNEALFKELLYRANDLEKEETKLFQELQVTAEQISQFMDKPENFTPENWEKIKTHQAQLSEKLDLELKNIKNPRKTKKAYQKNIVNNRWIFVR